MIFPMDSKGGQNSALGSGRMEAQGWYVNACDRGQAWRESNDWFMF